MTKWGSHGNGKASLASVPKAGAVPKPPDDLCAAGKAIWDMAWAQPHITRADEAMVATLARLEDEGASLRAVIGTAMAAAGVPMRTLQEWMGHRDFATTEIYADYVPNAEEVAMADRAFADPLSVQG